MNASQNSVGLKEKQVKNLSDQISNAKTLMIVSIKGLPSKQFQEIKKSLRKQAAIKVIMKKLKFIPRINEKHIWVRSYAGFDKLLYLYKIKAFKNTPNWKKLIILVNENLKGRRLNTYLRFLDFSSNETIMGKDLIEKYNIASRSANNWLNSKEREGFLMRINKGYPVQWTLTKKALDLSNILSQIGLELNNLDIDTTKIASQLN